MCQNPARRDRQPRTHARVAIEQEQQRGQAHHAQFGCGQQILIVRVARGNALDIANAVVVDLGKTARPHPQDGVVTDDLQRILVPVQAQSDRCPVPTSGFHCSNWVAARLTRSLNTGDSVNAAANAAPTSTVATAKPRQRQAWNRPTVASAASTRYAVRAGTMSRRSRLPTQPSPPTASAQPARRLARQAPRTAARHRP